MLHIIGGKDKNRRLATPKGSETRPTSALLRAAVFNILQNNIEGARVLDLCAGSGAMGFEALSRGAAFVHFVEKDKAAAHCIRQNVTTLKAENETKLVQSDALSTLHFYAKNQIRFDLIYIDPPYAHLDLCKNILEYLDEHPILNPDGWILLEGGHKQNTSQLPPFKNLKVVDERTYGKSSLIFIKLG